MSRKQRFFKRAAGLVNSFVNAMVLNYEDKSKDVWKYGKNNLLPNDLLKFLANSGVATRAANKVAEYIASDGFVNEAAAKLQINPFQTADQLLQEAAVYVSMLDGCALKIARNAGGEVAQVTVLPFQCIRRKINGGGYLYNPNFGQPRMDNKDDIHFPEYVPRKLTLDELKSDKFKHGELLYIYKKSPYSTHYPVPDYYAQIEDVRTSAEISKMDLELTLNGFMPSALITLVGEYDDATKDPNTNLTEVQQVQQDFKQFTGQEKNEEGTASRFKAWLTFARTKEEIPTIQTLDVKSILESSNSKRDIIDRSVCRLFGVHPVLLGYSDAAVLGNTQALSNASLELNKVVNSKQRMLTDAFKRLYPAMDWTISEYMPINYIPDALLADMTQDERRNKLLGLPPLTQTQPANGIN